ncbi:gpkow [Scenedesmus sp. PABB004]|nr:gpkow [Scenedesmus sp. PABB004]
MARLRLLALAGVMVQLAGAVGVPLMHWFLVFGGARSHMHGLIATGGAALLVCLLGVGAALSRRAAWRSLHVVVSVTAGALTGSFNTQAFLDLRRACSLSQAASAGCAACACALAGTCTTAQLAEAPGCGGCAAVGADLCSRAGWAPLLPYTGLLEAVLLALPAAISLAALAGGDQRGRRGKDGRVAVTAWGDGRAVEDWPMTTATPPTVTRETGPKCLLPTALMAGGPSGGLSPQPVGGPERRPGIKLASGKLQTCSRGAAPGAPAPQREGVAAGSRRAPAGEGQRGGSSGAGGSSSSGGAMADGDGKASLSLGFKISGKARPRVAVNAEPAPRDDRQLITGVAAHGFVGAEPPPEERAARVIPALQNTYKAGVGKFVPTFVPESSAAAVTGHAEDRYERAAAPDAPAVTAYGLQLRDRREPRDGERDGGARGNGDAPILPAPGGRGDEAAQLKADLEALPDAADLEDYEALPVEEFGKALLRGLGWAEGEGVGRTRQVVEPKQAVRRPDRLGLGANPAAPPPDKRPRKMGDKPKQADLVAAPDADGRVRHRVGLDEALVPRAAIVPGPAPGKAMAVVGGRHAGLACVVRSAAPRPDGASGPARWLVELRPSGEQVEVAADELADRGAPQAAPAPRKRERSRERSGSKGGERRERDRSRGGKERGRSRSRDRDRARERRRSRSRSRERGGGKERRRSRSRSRSRSGGRGGGRPAARRALPPARLWAAAAIRVRLVDKALGGGRLYLKKGVVLDVAPDGTCDVRLDDTRQVVSAHQDQLETVVPKEAGAAVMLVGGEHRGRKGRLLQVSISGGAAAVQLTGDMAVVRLLLDELAAYTGALAEED